MSNSSFSHSFFKRLTLQTRKNQGLFGKGYLLTTQYRLLATLTKKAFENIVEKGENAGNQHVLLFQQCFLPFAKQISIFQPHLFCCLQILSISTSLEFFCLVKSEVAFAAIMDQDQTIPNVQ